MDGEGERAALPESIAGFRVLRRLGEGGMGVVYEAGKARPWGTDGPELPYLVMELVEGQHITAHAAKEGLRTRQRLELMARVCDAVQHAHERDIIHRDLKPANVLVGINGQPSVLDFGVARALDSDVTRHTATSQLVGTLPYMSPEQLAEGTGELGPSSDIDSLGVLTYELLVGHRPLELEDMALGEAVLRLQTVDPPRLGSLDAQLRGDVEVIVSKALDKEASRL